MNQSSDKNLANQLRQVQETLTFALQSAKVGAWEIDLKSNRVSCSKELFEIWGIEPSAGLLTREILQSKVHPEDLQNMRATIDAAIQNRGIYDLEYRITSQSGMQKWVHSRGRCSYGEDSDQPVSLSGVVIDVTQKKLLQEAEQALTRQREWTLDQIFQESPSFMVLLRGTDFVLEKANRRYYELVARDESILGKTVHEVFPEAESQGCIAILKRVFQTGHRWVGSEIPISISSTQGGTTRYYADLVFQPMRNEDGEIYGIIAQGFDVTEKVLARQAVEQAVQVRDTFMSIASHELKTPLSSLMLQIQLRKRALQKGDLQRFTPEKLSRSLDDDERQMNRIVRLVDDMLDISRIETGKFALSGEAFDFREMVQDTLARFMPQIELQGCEVSLDAPDAIKGVWDRFRIEQVFINLLSNALKYGSEKPIDVRLNQFADRVVLAVKDHGIGIAQSDHERIFGQFERAISANSISGLGLGLFISKKIVEAHRGIIRVESDLGQGATFTIELPVLSLTKNQPCDRV